MRKFRIFKEIYYYIRYNKNIKFKIDRTLDVLVVFLLIMRIKKVEILDNRLIVIFGDNTILISSYNKKWCSFMNNGILILSGNSEVHEKRYEWVNKMPPYEILYRFKKVVESKIKDQPSYDVYKYLPIDILRKIKLDGIS
jgi:hypothetical protein